MDECLDVPIPQCMREFVPTYLPQSAANYQTASQVTGLIRHFGYLHRIPEAEVQKCCLLAEGLDDLVVLLERPSPRHNYSVSFRDFVSQCATLAALDKLLRFASSGTRNINNVTTLDVYAFKPDGSRNIVTDTKCLDLCQDIILLKKPRVVLRCTAEIQRGSKTPIPPSHLLQQLNGTGITGTPRITNIELGNVNGSSLFIPSFHPSYSVNWVPWCGGTRLALIYHFILAMRCLIDVPVHPYWTSDLYDVTFIAKYARKRVDVIEDLLFSLREFQGIHCRRMVLINSDSEDVRYQHVFAEIHNSLWRFCTLEASSSGRALTHVMLCCKFLFRNTLPDQLFTQLLMALGKRQNYLQGTSFGPERTTPRLTTTLPATPPYILSPPSNERFSLLEELEKYLQAIQETSNTVAIQIQSIISTYYARISEHPIFASLEFLQGAKESNAVYHNIYNNYVENCAQIPSVLNQIFPLPRDFRSQPLVDDNIIPLQKVMAHILSSFKAIEYMRTAFQTLINTQSTAAHTCIASNVHQFDQFDQVLKDDCKLDKQQQASLRDTLYTIFRARAKLANCVGLHQAVEWCADKQPVNILPDAACWVGPDLALPAHFARVEVVVEDRRR